MSDRDLISGRSAPDRGAAESRTARRVVERERDDARDLFETAFSHAPIGMALVGLNGRWLKVNRAICRMTGWSQQELLERTFHDLSHPDDLSADQALMQQLIGGEIDDYRMEKRYVTRGGGHIWALLSVSLVRDEYGQPKHLIAQVQDIDDRKRTERRLLETEAEVRLERDHARTILAAMHEGYALTVEGEIVDVNDALCEMTGLLRQELIGCRPPYPFWPAERVRELAGVRGEVHSDTGGTFEAVFARANGTRFDVEVTAIPAFGADGARIGFVNTMRDVSLRNLQRRELERQARTDSLTGLANRYVLDEELERVTLGGDGETIGLVLFDLDRFKQINDEHGHPVGDAVLVEVAARLSRIARESEVLARVGGEEFAWLLSGCDACRRPGGGRPCPRRDRLRSLRRGGLAHAVGRDRRELHAVQPRPVVRAGRPGALRGQALRAQPNPLLPRPGRGGRDGVDLGFGGDGLHRRVAPHPKEGDNERDGHRRRHADDHQLGGRGEVHSYGMNRSG